MKKIKIIYIIFILTILVTLGTRIYASEEFVLIDDIGIAPNVRSFDEDKINFVELNEMHANYTKYGVGLSLSSLSSGREYITYDVSNVDSIEVSYIINQSSFGAYHGWGMSLGVSDNAAEMPNNNINNINLSQIYPIYLSEEGVPFIKRINEWMGYIEGKNVGQGKYSFAPSATNVSENLREFTIPIEVNDKLFPIINVEVYKEIAPNIYDWEIQSATEYKYKSIKFVGSDKEYLETVEIKNINDALKVRIGMNYIRKTLKPTSVGDIEPDVYEPFSLNYDESLFITQVKLNLSKSYDGGFVNLEQTGIIFDVSNSKRLYGYNEPLNDDDLVLLLQFENGIKDELNDEYILDKSLFNKLVPGIYEINATYNDFEATIKVQVLEPEFLLLDTTNVKLHYEGLEELDFKDLVVSVRTNIGSKSQPIYVDLIIDKSLYNINIEDAKMDETGIYLITIKLNDFSVQSNFEITVDASNIVKDNPNISKYIIITSLVFVVVSSGLGFYFYKKKKH